jgi:hypothetical protein
LVELPAILLEQVGIVKVALLPCDLGLQFRDFLGQRFQRVLLIEIEPAP